MWAHLKPRFLLIRIRGENFTGAINTHLIITGELTLPTQSGSLSRPCPGSKKWDSPARVPVKTAGQPRLVYRMSRGFSGSVSRDTCQDTDLVLY